jgi:hypothetical protein
MLASTLRRLLAPTLTLGLLLAGWPLPAQAASADRISINDVSITEGNTGTKNLTFRISYSGPKNSLSVHWATADGTALAGSDYTASSGTANLPRGGSRSATVSVPIKGDTSKEPNETFTINLTNAQPSTKTVIRDAQGIGTILDDDTTPTVSVADAAPVTEGNVGTVTASFQVDLSNASTKTVSVHYSTANGTATATSDYASTSGTLTFAPGDISKTVDVTVNGDALDEVDETFTLVLSSPANATIADGSGIATILDDDGAPSISVGDVTLSEGDAGTSNATFTVTLAPASGKSVSVDYATTDGSATAPSDYSSAGGTLTFSPGQTSKSVDVVVKGDNGWEPDETFTLDLSNASNAGLSDGQGLGTITNDDPLPAVSIGDLPQFEGNAGTSTMTFDVSLDRPSAGTVTVDYASADASATAADDYVGVSGTATFAPGVTHATIDVTVNGDGITEPDETFTVDLSNPSNGTIIDGSGLGTILDDDGPSTVSVGDVTILEGNVGTSPATFTVSLSHSSASAVTVDFATADGTAISGSDFDAKTGTLTFVPGDTSQTIDVTVNGDATFENDEGFTVDLSNATNASIGDGTGAGTITNDDRAATHLTLRVRQTDRKVIARGTMESAAQGMHVRVRLFRRSHGRFRRIGSATVLVKKIRDRDHDSLPDGTFRAAFGKPTNHGHYRCTVSFAGDTANLPSTARKGFRL